MEKKKIIVLGGGLSSITAIYTLMQEENAKEKYEITVYQLGWRIGGKGASGVNTEIANRIEEHGLHLWMGFYENAFRTIKKCYNELNRPIEMPLSRFESAFKSQDTMTFAENIKGEWRDWKIKFPEYPGTLGDGIVPGANEFIEMWFDFLAHKLKEWKHTSLSDHHGSKKRGRWFSSVHFWVKGKLGGFVETRITDAFSFAMKRLRKIQRSIIEREDKNNFILDNIQELRSWLWDILGNILEGNDKTRRAFVILDLGIAILNGMIKDRVLIWKDGKLDIQFDVINEYDYREWLIKNGAHPTITAYCPLVTAMYDGPFSFKFGNANSPDVEAGTSLRIFLRLAFTCKEHVVWKMQAGMGDTIFAPLYELLVRDYGVQFKFFHEVKSLKLNADKTSVASIVIARQVDLKVENVYEPLIDVKGLPCWPSEPVYDYIESDQADFLKKNKIDLESPWANWEAKEIIELHHERDFETIIAGFSLATVPYICAEMVQAFPSWYKMVQKVQTVQTQSWQLWFNADAAQLEIEEDKILSTYVETMDTFASMNQLLERENWSQAHTPKYMVYLCGAMQHSYLELPHNIHIFQENEAKASKKRLEHYLENHFKHLIPKAFDENGNFIWELLVDENNNKGVKRLDAQYIRPNISPTDRYVMSVSGSSKYRLKTDETGCSNLFITGDWIKNGFNAGFVEGAVVSGLLTARAVSGCQKIEVIGEAWFK